MNLSLMENVLFANCESGAVTVEGLPKEDHGWIYSRLVQANTFE